MTDKRTVVKVTIGSDEYTLKSDRPSEYTEAVAQHVDGALREVLQSGSIIETHKAAILAAMKITDELFRARTEREQLERAVADRLGALAGRVEGSLHRTQEVAADSDSEG